MHFYYAFKTPSGTVKYDWLSLHSVLLRVLTCFQGWHDPSQATPRWNTVFLAGLSCGPRSSRNPTAHPCNLLLQHYLAQNHNLPYQKAPSIPGFPFDLMLKYSTGKDHFVIYNNKHEHSSKLSSHSQILAGTFFLASFFTVSIQSPYFPKSLAHKFLEP